MKFTQKLMVSYLAVTAIALLVIALSTAVAAPESFRLHMMGHAAEPQGMMPGGMRQAMDVSLEIAVRDAVNTTLLWAALAALAAAIVVSWFMSRRVVHPIRDLIAMSRYIAAGHYESRLHKRTNDEIGDLTQSFNLMAEALAQTEATRRQLLGDVTHELKTPLASIKAYVEGLQDHILPANADTFQLLHREASRLQRLVEDLQELSQVEAQQIKLELRRCDTRAVVLAATERMRLQFDENAIALQVDLSAVTSSVYADGDRLAQILTNLLGNALQYTPPGGSVTIAAAGRGAEVEFSVSDTGVGLATDNLDRVFQRFYRVDKSRSRNSGGSGIGLTIARHLVEAQGGRIWAVSPGPGKGSTFSFTLPKATSFTETSHDQHGDDKHVSHPVDR